MTYEVDQSNKIEQTQKDTVLSISNGVKMSIVLLAKDKRTIQQKFREIGKPEVFIQFTFSALLAILLNKSRPNSKVIVDHEYLGHEDIIKLKLKTFLDKLSCPSISLVAFEFIGKRSPAHNLALKISRSKERKLFSVPLKTILQLIFPAEIKK